MGNMLAAHRSLSSGRRLAAIKRPGTRGRLRSVYQHAVLERRSSPAHGEKPDISVGRAQRTNALSPSGCVERSAAAQPRFVSEFPTMTPR